MPETLNVLGIIKETIRSLGKGVPDKDTILKLTNEAYAADSAGGNPPLESFEQLTEECDWHALLQAMQGKNRDYLEENAENYVTIMLPEEIASKQAIQEATYRNEVDSFLQLGGPPELFRKIMTNAGIAIPSSVEEFLKGSGEPEMGL